MRQIVTIFLLGLLWGCGSGGTPADLVVFHDPDRIEDSQVARAAEAVVKLELYSHRGTGFFISGTGYLLTNHHVAGREVCARECSGLEAIAFQQRGRDQVQYRGARLIFSDADLDLALLKVEVGAEPVAFVRLSAGDPDEPVDQQWPVSVVGHPFGDLKKYTLGTIDFRNDDVYFIDAFIFPGNSGSPMLDARGEALGLVQAIYYWIGDITRKGQYGDSGVATTTGRILEKYPFLVDLNRELPPLEAEERLARAVAAMSDGLPLDADVLQDIPADSLVRGDAGMVTSLLAHLDREWVFPRLLEIWDRVGDRAVFEEYHRYNAARALFVQADTDSRQATVGELLTAHTPRTDPAWTDSFLWLINQLGGDQAVSFSQAGLLELYAGYRVSPVLAAIFLAFGIREMDSTDLLDVCEQLFADKSGPNTHYLIAKYLDRFRFPDPADEQRVIGILRDIRKRSNRVRAVFHAEQALYNRGVLDSR